MAELIPRGARKRDWGQLASERVSLRDSFQHLNSFRSKLWHFRDEDRYVDVKLKLDDGSVLPCHKVVLAAASNYFDCMMSSGMRESHEDRISVVGVTKTIMSTALEYVYTSKCSFEYADFFDMIIVANMFELKDLETALVSHIAAKIDVWGPQDRHSLEFLIETLMFCQRFPVIAETLKLRTGRQDKLVSLKDGVYESLRSQKRWEAFTDCDNLMESDFEFFATLYVCHDPENGKTYKLLAPDVSGYQVFGELQLMISSQNGGRVFDLLCHHGHDFKPVSDEKLSQSSLNETGNDKESAEIRHFSVIRHRYSVSKQRWVREPDDVNLKAPRRIVKSLQERVALQPKHILTPSVVPSNCYPILRISQDTSTKLHDGTNTELKLSSPETKLVSSSQNAPVAECPDYQGINVVEAYTMERDNNLYQENDIWKCHLRNLEVNGISCYDRENRSYGSNKTGIVILGNSYVGDGTCEKSALTLLNPVRKKSGFPGNYCDKAFSVVQDKEKEHVFVLPTAPYVHKSKKGHLMFKLPRVFVFSPQSLDLPWFDIPTPTCPNLDYVSLYYDPIAKCVCLVMVQAEKSSALFSALLKNKAENVGRGGLGNRGRGKGKNRKKSVPRPSPRQFSSNGRIACLFKLNMNAVEISDAKESRLKLKLSTLWSPLPLSDVTADFLSLGCRLPSEVRITPARINTAHLETINLKQILSLNESSGTCEIKGATGTEEHRAPWAKNEFMETGQDALQNKLGALLRSNPALATELDRHRLPFPLRTDVKSTGEDGAAVDLKFDRYAPLHLDHSAAFFSDSDDDNDDDEESYYDYTGYYSPSDDSDRYLGYGSDFGYDDDVYGDYGGWL